MVRGALPAAPLPPGGHRLLTMRRHGGRGCGRRLTGRGPGRGGGAGPGGGRGDAGAGRGCAVGGPSGEGGGDQAAGELGGGAGVRYVVGHGYAPEPAGRSRPAGRYYGCACVSCRMRSLWLSARLRPAGRCSRRPRFRGPGFCPVGRRRP
ncbi:hypothetical protein EAO68_01665 [Streptomyces sp. wa22]|nr:hypothetical protein EAO68_01665 [Streptomyces sp. wa22]